MLVILKRCIMPSPRFPRNEGGPISSRVVLQTVGRCLSSFRNMGDTYNGSPPIQGLNKQDVPTGFFGSALDEGSGCKDGIGHLPRPGSARPDW